MNILVLTSSRADYGIYLPLLKRLNNDRFFNLKIAAFGTHLCEEYGRTLDQIINDGFDVKYKIQTVLGSDSPEMISKSMALTTHKFSELWTAEKSELDYIICLGDRYEMFAAIAAAVPFNIPIAHIHGGETTLGAIDNAFRHSLTSMAKLHFASTQNHADRVIQITGTKQGVYNVGALSLDNLNDIEILSKDVFKKKFDIELNNPVLVTFHPETVSYEKNEEYTDQLISVLKMLDKQIIITMPNADTMGNCIRHKLLDFASGKKNVVTVESFGTVGYFSCLHYCDFVLGNSSSGIIEAASFGKYVINIGKRQLGRDSGVNVIHCEIDKDAIIRSIHNLSELPVLSKMNIYGDGNTADKIISVLKSSV